MSREPNFLSPVFLHLPVARSRRVRALFVTTALVTVGLMIWMTVLRAEGDMHGLSPIFFMLFAYADRQATTWTLLILIVLLLIPTWNRSIVVLRWIGGNPAVVSAATTVVLCIGAIFVYRAQPLSMDEYAPVFQSQVFAAGRLVGQFPVDLLDWLIPKDFQNSFLKVSRTHGTVASGYWPSFALLLTPFTWLGVPWACNPVLSGLTLSVIHRLALGLFGNIESAGLAVLLTLASPVFFADGISYYSMAGHLLFNGLFALLLLRPTPGRIFAAGLAGSIALGLHNPLPHVLFAAPWFIWLATREHGLRKLSWLALAYLPLGLPLVVGWFWFLSDLVDGGAANVGMEGLAKVGSALTLPTPTVLLARTIGMAKVWLWAVPGLVVLACMGCWKWRHDDGCRLLAISAIATLVGYFFFWPDQGHGWGFRYFHSAWLALPLLAAAALTPCTSLVPGRPARLEREMTSFAVASALLVLVIGVGVRGFQIREFMMKHLAQLPAYAGTEERVMFIDPRGSFYGIDLVQNDPFLRDKVIRMVSAGPEKNAVLVHRFRPAFHQVYSDSRGEVWSSAPVTAGPHRLP